MAVCRSMNKGKFIPATISYSKHNRSKLTRESPSMSVAMTVISTSWNQSWAITSFDFYKIKTKVCVCVCGCTPACACVTISLNSSLESFKKLFLIILGCFQSFVLGYGLFFLGGKTQRALIWNAKLGMCSLLTYKIVTKCGDTVHYKY